MRDAKSRIVQAFLFLLAVRVGLTPFEVNKYFNYGSVALFVRKFVIIILIGGQANL